MADDTMSYVGRAECGCAVAALVIHREGDPVQDKKWQRQEAKDIAEWIRDGLTVEQQTVAWVRANLAVCNHPRPRKRKRA